jgi:hypothetical protein
MSGWAGDDESLVSQIMGLLMFVRPFLFDSGLSNKLTGTLPLWPRDVCSLCLLRYLSPHLLWETTRSRQRQHFRRAWP